MENLTLKTVPVDELLLDPNNPRLVLDCKERPTVPDSQAEAIQPELVEYFREKKAKDADDDFFDITSLADSMRRIGYVGVDRLVVRPLIDGSKGYIVVEGNRRLATIKRLRKESGLDPSVRDSMEKIEVLVLQTEGLRTNDWQHNITVILGIRHHGSLLEWGPLPSAYNIYKEYRKLHSEGEIFSLDTKTITHVRERLAIPRRKVESALKAYVAYLQLSKDPQVKDWHYSLIESLVTHKKLSANYLKQDPKTYALEEEGVERVLNLCQFGERDQLGEKEKILRKPQSVAKLALVVGEMENNDQAIRSRATSLVGALESGEAGMTVESAAEQLTVFMERLQWAETVLGYLKEQDSKLPFEQYLGTGNARARKDELRGRLQQLQVLIQFSKK